jgi:hypothetical protein
MRLMMARRACFLMMTLCLIVWLVLLLLVSLTVSVTGSFPSGRATSVRRRSRVFTRAAQDGM